MAAPQLFTDQIGKPPHVLKYAQCTEDIPDVDKYYLNRVYNRVDTQIGRRDGNEARLESRKSGRTWHETLRLIAEEVCLGGKLSEKDGSKKSAAQLQRIADIKATRTCLTEEFTALMGFYSVEVDLQTWTWREAVREGQVHTVDYMVKNMDLRCED